LNLERQADAVSSSIEGRIDQYVEVLYGLQGLFQSDPATSREEFAAVLTAADVTQRLSGFQALEWAPVVQHDALDTYEDSVREDRSLAPEG
jgi:CHASE1-domain containing sensor protein